MYAFLRKSTAVLLSLIIGFSLVGCAGDSPSPRTSCAAFDEFCMDLFRQEISSNTLSLHYTIAKPSSFGIEDYEVGLGELSSDGSYEKTCKLLASLRDFEMENLDLQQQFTYDALEYELKLRLESESFRLFDEVLSPHGGLQVELPLLLAEMPLRSTTDVDDYLEMLDCVDDLFENILQYENEKAARGLFMSDEQLEGVLASCDKILSTSEDGFMFSSFTKRLDSLKEVTESDRDTYIKNHSRILKEVFFPAYEKLVDGLALLKGKGTNELGLCQFQDGREYYEHLVKCCLGTSLSIPDLFQEIEKARDNDLQACAVLFAENQNLFEECSDIRIPCSSEKDMIQRLQQEMVKEFPAPVISSCDVAFSDEAMADFLAPAYYLTAPMDAYTENTIYINGAKAEEGIYYFTTLAHEGFPGHLYQTTMSYSYGMKPVQLLFSSPSFVEGWATYVELLSFRYAGLSDDVASFLIHNRSATLSLYATSDLGIHYFGWNEKDLLDFWKQYGINSKTTVHEIAQLVISNPGNYLKYYVGYLQIEKLKEKAKATLGSAYTDVNFHETLLRMGPAPFDVIEKYFDRFYSRSI